jgi:class 3 adenylate cyclase/tetratricopeptide (TPR) repeat protein
VGAFTSSTASLERFVPRLAVEWDDDSPGPRWRSLPGTLCFVDISGFTSLSEKLARRGRIGAEELTEVLNRVFGSMLELAYARGGSLLKFGGDALLLLFTGEERVLQGCSAAVEMRAALRDAAEMQTSVGRVPLKMSVGIHDGRVDVFLVGGSHRELIISGPTATMTTTMEGTAEAGEILVSPEVAAALPSGSADVVKGLGRILRWRTAKVEASGAMARSDVGARAYEARVPVALRGHLDQHRAESEHRLATIAFVKFKGVDELLRANGAAGVAHALDELVRSVQAAADEEAVTFLATDIDADGGKIILASGVPTARGDDEGRVLRVARRIMDTPHRLPLRIGIHRGHVFSGEIGTTFRATYTVMGDTVNLAARLMAAAGADEIYASPEVLDRARTLFETRALEPFAVKGKAEPVQAYEVGTELGARPIMANDEFTFVGREPELAQLRELVGGTDERAGRIAVVTGDLGLGKTRLIHHAIAAFGTIDVLTIRGEPYGTAIPYRAFRDAIRDELGIARGTTSAMGAQLVASIAETTPELAPYAPLIASTAHLPVDTTAVVEAIDPQFRRDRLADILIALLEQRHRGALLIVVDDAHWMDDSSAHLLDRLAGAAADRPWAMVVARETGTAGFVPSGATEIPLQPLNTDAVMQIIRTATVGAPLHPHDVSEIVARVGGSPLFLAELLRTVGTTGMTAGLPETLESLVGAQIDALPPLARRLLRYAAVLGRSFGTNIVERVLEDEGIALDAASRASLADFIEPDGDDRLQFRHAMVRDVAYEGLSYRLRQTLHLRAGEAVEAVAGGKAEDVADLLSLHYSLGQQHPRAWHFARIAGDRASENYANVEAATHYVRALEAARRLPDVDDEQRADVLTRLGDARERAGMFSLSLDAYKRASHLVVGNDVRSAELLLKRARARERAGSFPVALRELTAGANLLRDAETDDARLIRARINSFSAMVRWGQERSRDALRRAEAAIDEARSVGAQEALAQALMVADIAEFALQGSGVGTRLREALSIFEELDDLPRQGQARGNLGFLAAHGGRWDEAVDWFSTSRAVFDRSGDAVGTALGDLNLGEILINQCREEDAELALENAARVLRSVGFSDGAAYAELQLARVWCELGRIDEAEEQLARVAAEFTDLGQHASALEAALFQADARFRRGDPTSALELLERAETAAGGEADQFVARVALVRAAALAALDQIDESEAELERGITTASERGLPHDEALLLVLRAEIRRNAGRPTDLASAQRAEEILTGLGVRHRDRSG